MCAESYPFYDADPYLMGEAPHVYFAGNQPAFETGIVEGAFSFLVTSVVVCPFCWLLFPPRLRPSNALTLLLWPGR
jgi:hypothetical protein